MKDAFEASEDDIAHSGVVIVDDLELDFSIFLFLDSWLLGEIDWSWCDGRVSIRLREKTESVVVGMKGAAPATSTSPFVPFCKGDSVRAFLDLEEEASSEAFRLAVEVSGA